MGGLKLLVILVRSRRRACACRCLVSCSDQFLLRTIKEQRDAGEHVSSQHAPVIVDQQVTSTITPGAERSCPIQTACAVLRAAVKTYQLIVAAGDGRNAQSRNGCPWKQRDVGPGVHEHEDV